MRSVATISLMIGLTGLAHAEAPQVPTDAPFIVLSDNLDEPNGYGFCIDTYGRGQTDLLQTHSCKPSDRGEGYDADTRFAYDAGTMQLSAHSYDGYCMQALIANDRTEFALLPCTDHPRQKFVYDAADQTLRLNEDPARCITVAGETQPAGPWVKRPLLLETCDEAEAALKQWTVAAE